MLLSLVGFSKENSLRYEGKTVFLDHPWWGTAPPGPINAQPLSRDIINLRNFDTALYNHCMTTKNR